MLDIGWSELLVIGVVALIVVGPKELPKLFRTVGRFVGKARGMAREFQRAMERAADETGVNEVKKTFQDAGNTTSFGFDDIRNTLNSSDLPDQKKQKPIDAAREHADRVKKQREAEEAVSGPEADAGENTDAAAAPPQPKAGTDSASDKPVAKPGNDSAKASSKKPASKAAGTSGKSKAPAPKAAATAHAEPSGQGG